MEDNILVEIINSEVVKCPFKDCESWASYNQCFNHSYCLCNNFEKWYDELTKEEIDHIFYRR